MSPVTRAFLVFASSLGLVGATCGGSTPPPVSAARVVAPPAATELVLPPPEEISICQRDARPTTGGDAETARSFEQFSREWIDKMKAVAAARFTAQQRRLRETYEMELRPTGSARAPYVGVLSYCEITLQCASSAETVCRAASSTVVKEVFRYEAGKWMY
jgi:hypothetical protein